jgi:2-haloacid dehalogenase
VSTPPDVVVFDVNETLSDLRPLRVAFQAAGVPGSLLETWFAAVLRDGFALAVNDTARPFQQVAVAVLRSLLAAQDDVRMPLDDAVESIMAGFMQLGVHPDVAAGLQLLADAGVRVVTLSNGSAGVAQGLLERAGLSDLVEQTLSVEQAGRWKPHPRSYGWAAQHLGVAAHRLALLAVHAWDVDGASRAGWTGAWLNRTGAPYPEVFLPPALTARDLPALVERLLAR